MKKNTYLFAGFIAASTILSSCGDKAPSGDNATIQEKQEKSAIEGVEFTVDTAESRIRFTGNGVGKNHPGKFKLASGKVAIANDKITGGSFVINIKTMELEEKGGMFQEKLHPHLMSGDFFDAEKFGTAKFDITDVKPYQGESKDTSVVDGANFTISGNLTIKSTTKNISFPAKVDLDGNTLKAKADFDIDRTQWQISYGNDKTLGDKFISEKVNIELDFKAKKQ